MFAFVGRKIRQEELVIRCQYNRIYIMNSTALYCTIMKIFDNFDNFDNYENFDNFVSRKIRQEELVI